MDPEFRAQQERLRALRAEPVPAIIIAARDGDVDALRRELDLGVSVDLADAWKSTPLQVACGAIPTENRDRGRLESLRKSAPHKTPRDLRAEIYAPRSERARAADRRVLVSRRLLLEVASKLCYGLGSSFGRLDANRRANTKKNLVTEPHI